MHGFDELARGEGLEARGDWVLGALGRGKKGRSLGETEEKLLAREEDRFSPFVDWCKVVPGGACSVPEVSGLGSSQSNGI